METVPAAGPGTEAPNANSDEGLNPPTGFPFELARPSILSVRLAPEINRVLRVSNLPKGTTGERLYDLFGKFGAIRQLRIGNTEETTGQAFVIYEDIYDAKKAVDALLGKKVGKTKFLHLEYFDADKEKRVKDRKRRRKELEQEFKQHLKEGVADSEEAQQ